MIPIGGASASVLEKARGPPSKTAFARLVPVNTAAKMAFNAMYESILLEDSRLLDGEHIHVQPKQTYDKGVLLFWLQEQKTQGDSDSDSPTEPDTDTEDTLQHQGMIWTGWFSFGLGNGPYNSALGWTLGKGGRKGIFTDFLLPSTPASIGLRGYHARFNLHQTTGHLFISKTSSAPNAEVIVNGKGVNNGENFSLNQTPMNIRVGNLELEFQYTDYAYTDDFYRDRWVYMSHCLGSMTVPNCAITPTPSRTFRCFGQWTMSNSLGKGAYGKVSSATNSKGEVVAIKVVVRRQWSVRQICEEIRILQEIQKLSEVHEGDRERVVRLKEAIYQNGEEAYTPSVFEEVALVLEPAVSATFANIISSVAGSALYFDLPEIASLFHEALLGLNFLHSHGWVHGDLKPGNIGILDVASLRVVLLDFGGATNLKPGTLLPASPGIGGTINYIAPERELQAHDHLIDVWSLGVIGFELLYGYHPWKLAVNPWRLGNRFEVLRPTFQSQYRKAVREMEHHEDEEFNDLLLQMVRHRWAEVNKGRRISAQAALSHVCWQTPEEDQRPLKRSRE
ncbi:hypothetical protein FQN49_002052 [Arthroderma sp. PD_2]|nr:hypothetical protein FQN49_002052 [Arthroderma sp. PD_2]